MCDDASSVKLRIEGFYGKHSDTLSSEYPVQHFLSQADMVAIFTYELKEESIMALCPSFPRFNSLVCLAVGCDYRYRCVSGSFFSHNITKVSIKRETSKKLNTIATQSVQFSSDFVERDSLLSDVLDCHFNQMCACVCVRISSGSHLVL